MTTSTSKNCLYGAVLTMSVLLSACAVSSETWPTDVDPETDDTDSTSQALDVLGTVTLDSPVDDGWWMESTASVRDDGVIVGSTELKNSRSFFGFHGETTVVLVDKDRQPLSYVTIGTWGIDACKWNCPRTRFESWSVPAPEWASVGPAVRGAAIVHRHNPQNTFWQWWGDNMDEVLKVAGMFF